MPAFRTKSLVVEALQLRWDNWPAMCAHADVGRKVDGRAYGCYLGPDGLPLAEGLASNEMGMLIPTTSGWSIARQNDYVVKSPDGTLQAIRVELFEQLFDSVP